MKKLKFENIKQFTQDGNYEVDFELTEVYEFIKRMSKRGYKVNLQPDYQRKIVWDDERCSSFLEYFSKGGRSGRVIYFNCPDWGDYSMEKLDFECVDGQQRLHAIKKFMDGKIKIFGKYIDEIDKTFFMRTQTIKLNVNNLKSEKEVLEWYLGINSGGIPHSKEEIKRVENMIKGE